MPSLLNDSMPPPPTHTEHPTHAPPPPRPSHTNTPLLASHSKTSQLKKKNLVHNLQTVSAVVMSATMVSCGTLVALELRFLIPRARSSTVW